ncbi:MAG: Spx/MgsR family RNA polymerase-binding regulatory protein [Tissierellia bacterium]|nr:Spx/MgsR family RNA polymerase-binding regulatory protein [Tissierellia bacterium]
MKLICYKKCGTCRQVEKILSDKSIPYEYRHIDQENPTVEELQKWHKISGLDIKKFFNTSGLLYKEMNLKDKLKDMTLEEKIELLSTNGLLVKRPILIDDEKIFVGADVKKFVEGI